jgi:O-antigen/teichoic acid export membrane protein
VDHLYAKTLFMIVSFAFGSIVILYCFKDFIFSKWLGAAIYSSSYKFIMGFLSYEMLLVLMIPPYYFLNGAGYIKLNTAFEISIKLLNIICMISLFMFIGVLGLVYGLILASLIFIPIQNYIIKRVIFGKTEIVRSMTLLLPSLFIVVAFNTHSVILTAVFIILALFFLKLIYFDTLKH